MQEPKTPLRYPGGKQRLAPFILEILRENDLVGGDYVEPYAGGAGVAVELLLGGHMSRIHINDSSLPIYAFWHAILTHTEEFCHLVSVTPLTVNEWTNRRTIVQNPTSHSLLEVGFSTFYLNRCNRSGVLTGGLIGGLAQNGKWNMDARFPRERLIRRIEEIATKKNSVVVTRFDAEDFILNHIPRLPEKSFVYCDPPYFNQSSRLYLNRYKREDHARLAKVIQQHLHRKWVVSYDGAVDLLMLYPERKKFLYDLQYNARRAYKGKEVFIFSDSVRIPRSSSLGFVEHALRRLVPTRAPALPAIAA
jgi:DNA adenine methylase